MGYLKISLMMLMTVVLSACARSASPELSGVIVYGHEIRTIRLCGDSQTFWLHATEEEQRKLVSKSRSLTSYPYQELYLEFYGSMLNEPSGEFAKAYAGSIKVEQVRNISVVIPNSCISLRVVP